MVHRFGSRRLAAFIAGLVAFVACGSGKSGTEPAAPQTAGTDGAPGTKPASPSPSPPSPAGLPATPTLADKLLAITKNCQVASTAQYAVEPGIPPAVDICALKGAYWWFADMDVDCDGRPSDVCSADTDPAYQPDTSFKQSDGQPLDASTLPYVVVPLPSARFDYKAAGIAPGAVVAVIYQGKLVFGVFGDEGPADIIGEASYALVKSLGIDPDPKTGGLGGKRAVTYIAFTGAPAVAAPIEDHGAAVTLGTQLATKLVTDN